MTKLDKRDACFLRDFSKIGKNQKQDWQRFLNGYVFKYDYVAYAIYKIGSEKFYKKVAKELKKDLKAGKKAKAGMVQGMIEWIAYKILEDEFKKSKRWI